MFWPMTALDFYLFLPQMRMSLPEMVERAKTAERSGFSGITGMDHLAPPMAEGHPMYDSTVTNTWLAAHTDSIRVGSLVLCDALRHPAVLAREAVSMDHASGGRFDLGLGWGSVPTELATFGVGSTEPRERVDRMAETLEVLHALWSGETVDYQGRYFTLKGAVQTPVPLGRIPIVIGGAGRKTMKMVARYADWWNLHTGMLDRLEELRDQAGDARPSLQIRVGLVPSEAEREGIEEVVRRRFGSNPFVGTAPELVDHFGSWADRGVQRMYVWFTDFAPPATLEAFGETVISQFN
jgi:alkanesulfonate monooxygenase SsuD/methylene tetrahydromethanopterin reductase-like flavin-dependent oxidoreductase (luciferase family)